MCRGPFIVPIRKIPLTAETSAGSFSLTHHKQAVALGKVSDPKVRQKRIDKGEAHTRNHPEGDRRDSGQFYVDSGRRPGREHRRDQSILRRAHEKSEYDAPSSELVGVLEEYLAIVKDLARDKLPKPQAPAVVGIDRDGSKELLRPRPQYPSIRAKSGIEAMRWND